MKPNFVIVFNVLLPICSHIGSGLLYLLIFCEESFALFGAKTDKWLIQLIYCRNQKTSNDQAKFEAKNINVNFNACELSVKRVVTFGAVLYRKQ